MNYRKLLGAAAILVPVLLGAGFYIRSLHPAPAHTDTVYYDFTLPSLLQQQVNSGAIRFSDKMYTEKGDTATLQQLVKKESRLVFSLSQVSCPPCIDFEFQELRKLAAAVGKEKILIQTGYSSRQDITIFKNVNNIDLPVFNLPYQIKERCDVRLLQNPHLYLLDSTLQIHMVFFPEEHPTERANNYFNAVKKYFLSRQHA
jgi:hypothetical protein